MILVFLLVSIYNTFEPLPEYFLVAHFLAGKLNEGIDFFQFSHLVTQSTFIMQQCKFSLI
jgi:hypothetical protein